MLARHFEAIQLCSEALIRNRWETSRALTIEELWQSADALDRSLHLARLHKDDVTIARWESEVSEFVRLAGEKHLQSASTARPTWHDWIERYGWQESSDQPWHFADLWQAVDLAAAAIWQGVGVDLSNETIHINPTWPTSWSWWALHDLPTTGGKLRLVWDGSTLHSTLPIASQLPTQLHERIRLLGFDELDWNPRFEFVDGDETSANFYPQFT